MNDRVAPNGYTLGPLGNPIPNRLVAQPGGYTFGDLTPEERDVVGRWMDENHDRIVRAVVDRLT